LGVPAAHSNN